MNRSRRDEWIDTMLIHNKGFRHWIRTRAWKIRPLKLVPKSRFSVFTTLPILKWIFQQKFKNLMAIFIFMAMISSKTPLRKKSVWLLYSVKSLLFGCFFGVFCPSISFLNPFSVLPLNRLNSVLSNWRDLVKIELKVKFGSVWSSQTIYRHFRSSFLSARFQKQDIPYGRH